MTNTSNPLVPTSIVDKNGRQTTVHKKLMTGGGSGNVPLPSPGASLKSGKGIDWKNTSTEDAIKMAQAVTPTLSDPTYIWQNFEFYTGMLRSRHRVEARALFEKHEVLGTLRDAWLDMHGAALMVDREKYSKIKGANGYNAFIKGRDALLEAYNRPVPSKFKPSRNSSSESSGGTLNPFAALRERKERKDMEYRQKVNVRDALDRAAPLSYGDESDSLTNSLSGAELEKASEVIDILWEQKDEEAIKNFGRAMHLDDDDKHGMIHIIHAHKDYVKENPGHLGVLGETARYLKDKGWDNQQEDGSVPHLEGYVNTLANDIKDRMILLGETEAENIPLKPYLDRAIRHYNQQRVNSVG